MTSWFLRVQVAALRVVLRTAAAGAAVAAPLAGFQYYGWLQHCGSQHAAAAAAGQLPLWCSQRVPYLYGYVQSHYWGVGFLKYWQPQQVRPVPSCNPERAHGDRELVISRLRCGRITDIS